MKVRESDDDLIMDSLANRPNSERKDSRFELDQLGLSVFSREMAPYDIW